MPLPACRQQAGPPEIVWQAQGNARTTGQQQLAVKRLAQHPQILIADCIGHSDGAPCMRQSLESRPGRCRAFGNGLIGHQTDRNRGLPRQNPHQIGITHRVQRMVLHRTVGQQGVTDKQMPLIDRAAIFGKSRTGHRPRHAEMAHQRFGHRADIALIGRIEGRAIFEQDLPRSGMAKGIAGL